MEHGVLHAVAPHLRNHTLASLAMTSRDVRASLRLEMLNRRRAYQQRIDEAVQRGLEMLHTGQAKVLEVKYSNEDYDVFVMMEHGLYTIEFEGFPDTVHPPIRHRGLSRASAASMLGQLRGIRSIKAIKRGGDVTGWDNVWGLLHNRHGDRI